VKTFVAAKAVGIGSRVAVNERLGDGGAVRRILGTVVAPRAVGEQIVETIQLETPIEENDVNDEAYLGHWRNGVPLGFRLMPLFEGRHESGQVEIAILGVVAWILGVAEVNAGRFMGLRFTVPR
jgi:hypothetical protein